MEPALLEVEHALVLRVAGRARSLGRLAGARDDHRDVADAEREQPPLERAEQLAAEPLPPPFRRHRPAEHPRALAVDARRDRAGHLVADERHERRLPRRDRAEHVGERERDGRPGGAVLPQAQRVLQVRVVEIADHGLGTIELDGLRQLHRGVLSALVGLPGIAAQVPEL